MIVYNLQLKTMNANFDFADFLTATHQIFSRDNNRSICLTRMTTVSKSKPTKNLKFDQRLLLFEFFVQTSL